MKKLILIVMMGCLLMGIMAVAGAETKPCVFHKWGEWETVAYPTCGNSGTKVRRCSVCSKAEVRGISPTGEHQWQEYMTEIPATCEKAGTEVRKCAKCDATENREIASLGGHQWGEWKTVSMASCTKAGKSQRVCGRCQMVETREFAAIGHSYGSWRTVAEATCTEAGEKVRTCGNCGLEDHLDLAPLGHLQTDAILHQTCSRILYGCPVCRLVLDEVMTGKQCEVTDALLGFIPETGCASLGCPVCGDEYMLVDLSVLHYGDWTIWEWNGNGTHSRQVKAHPTIVETRPCYAGGEGGAVCGLCDGAFIARGNCTALTEIPVYNEEAVLQTTIPAGAAFTVIANGDHAMVAYEGVIGYIDSGYVNFVDDIVYAGVWVSNGNGTHSRPSAEDLAIMETEPCYPGSDEALCGACGDVFITDGLCVAQEDIPLLAEMRNDPENENAAICIIPAGASFTVLHNGDYAEVEYEGQSGYISGAYVNFVSTVE